MTSQQELSSSVVPPSAVAGVSAWQLPGALAGLVGAATLAIWFFVLDVSRGQPLHTPTVLATALVGSASELQSPETLHASVPLTLFFTLVHGGAFLAIGLGASWFFARIGQVPRLALAILLLFVVLGGGFFVFAIVFARMPVDELFARDVLMGNILAASAMVLYLMRHHPSRSPV